MKLHKNLIIGLESALQQCLFENRYADKVIEKVLKTNKKWGSRDRSFISESFYEIIRWRRKIEFWMGEPFTEEKVNKAIFVYLLSSKYPGLDFKMFENVNYRKSKENVKKEITDLGIKFSFPDWLLKRIKEELPRVWQNEIKALNIPAKSIIRANTLKTNVKFLKEKLEEENIQSDMIPNIKDALALVYKPNVFKSDLFKNGFFEMQDASSQLVSEFAQVSPGMKVIDACAGAGGKTLHLAALMENKGQLIALDIHQWKLDELKKRAKRAVVHNVTIKLIEDTKVLKRLNNSADRVLIDAPCSGLGVLRRNPDAKWKLSPDFIQRMILEQQKVLTDYSKLVKEGGQLIYATCSILPSENQQQISWFLATNKNFKLVEEKALLTSESGYDGFYMARMEKVPLPSPQSIENKNP